MSRRSSCGSENTNDSSAAVTDADLMGALHRAVWDNALIANRLATPVAVTGYPLGARACRRRTGSASSAACTPASEQLPTS